MNEWQFWKRFAGQVTPLLEDEGIEPVLYTHYDGGSYTSAMSWLAGKLRVDGVAATIELHFNAYNGKAEGYEVLHYASSTGGRRLAEALLEAQGASVPSWQKSRGRKPIDSAGRGAQFLRKTHCPAVIWEPFFGDNKREWDHFSSCCGSGQLQSAFVSGIKNYFR